MEPGEVNSGLGLPSLVGPGQEKGANSPIKLSDKLWVPASELQPVREINAPTVKTARLEPGVPIRTSLFE